jgi:hypothetical protein
MAEWNVPYRFNIHDIDFDVTFNHLFMNLSKGEPRNWYEVTLAFARKVGTTEVLANKAVLNPHDKQDYIQGQRLAFKRLLYTVWLHWHIASVEPNNIILSTKFIQKGREIAHLASIWDEIRE